MDPRPGGFRPTVVAAVTDPSGRTPLTEASAVSATADEVEAKLAQLPGLPLAEHATLFADIHQQLTSALDATTGRAEHEQPPQSRGR